MSRTLQLRVDPIRCDAYGHCAELLPELIELDEWGYPMLDGAPVPRELLAHARRAVSSCPRLALTLEAAPDSQQARRPVSGTSKPGR